MADNSTDPTATPEGDAETAAPTRGKRNVKPHAPGRRPKPMRWNPEKAEQLRQYAAPITDENANRAAEDAATMAATDASGDLGLSPEDWAAAGAAMAQEAATQAPEAAADSDGEPENTEPPGNEFVHAFTPLNTEPEISSRDEKYREQLREAEADRDQLRGLVESMQRAEVERLASPRLADAADLFRDASLADMLDEGRPDPVKVDRAIDNILEQHPHWAAPRAAYRGELHSGSTSKRIEPTAPRWQDAFAPSAE
jgi:hypothetical protein